VGKIREGLTMKQWSELKDYVVKQMIVRPNKETEAYKIIIKQMEELEKKYKKLQNPYIDYEV
jgi:hypothetical protein